MGRCRMENKRVRACVRAFFSVRAPLTFICAVYPKAICPAVAEFRQIGADV